MAEVLPPLFQKWIDQLLPGGIPNETRATCSNCAMLAKGQPDDSDITFHPTTKCCTYYPELGNFIVGRILADDRPENYTALRTIQRRLEARINVTPLGVFPPPQYAVLYGASALNEPDVFGRAPALQCPFYIQQFGQCGIHQHRETVCSTFFCKYSRGAVGRLFWRTLAKLLGNLETMLRLWAIEQVDPSGAMTDAAQASEARKRPLDEYGLANTVPPERYAAMWGPWAGREVEFYRACDEHVGRLDFDQVLALGGLPAGLTARAVKKLHAGLQNPNLPERLTRGNAHLIQLSRVPNKVRIKSNSALYDFVDLPEETVHAASRLVDKPLAEARAQLAEEGVTLDDETLRWLLDFQILVPA